MLGLSTFLIIRISEIFGEFLAEFIPIRAAGWRLVYEVRESELLVLVIAVSKRDKNAVYRVAGER